MASTPTPREVSITIGEKDYLLTPSFSCILDIEQRSGKGINEILQAILEQRFVFTDLVTIVWGGIRAYYRAAKLDMREVPKWEELGDEIQTAGYINILAGLTEFITMIVNGTQNIQGTAATDGEPVKN